VSKERPASIVHSVRQRLLNISCMKDFYDLWILSRQFSFNGVVLAEAIGATFHRRNTAMPSDTPTALTEDFATDQGKQTQWKAFLNRTGLANGEVGLAQVVGELRAFLLPPLVGAAHGEPFDKSWTDCSWS